MRMPDLPPETSSPRLFASALMTLAHNDGRPFSAEAQHLFLDATGCRGDQWPEEEGLRKARMSLAYRLMLRAVLLAARYECKEVTPPILAAAIADQQ